MTTPIKIFGLAGSPRHANTDIIVKEGLEAAKRLGDVETRFLSLADLEVKPCASCWRCYTEAVDGKLCPQHDDDMQQIFDAFLWADGFIIGSPVYWGSVSAQIKCVFDRTMPFCHFASSKFKGGLSHKPVAAMGLAYSIYGGQDYAIQDIFKWALVQDMICVSSGPERPVACYYGGAGHTQPSSHLDAVKKHSGFGLKNVRSTGIRLAHVARLLKCGKQGLGFKEKYDE